MFSSEYKDLLDLLSSRQYFNSDEFSGALQRVIDSPQFVRHFKALHPSQDLPTLKEVYVETPFVTSEDTYEDDINFDFNLTILADSLYLYPFRPTFSNYTKVDELYNFIAEHNERHSLSTESKFRYVLTLSGEIVYFPKSLLAPFGGSSDIFSPREPHDTYFGIRPISPENLQRFQRQYFFHHLQVPTLPRLPRLTL